jgi:hypothetical protein
MNGTKCSRFSVLAVLGSVFLSMLFAFMPSSAAANPTRWQAHITRTCYPNPQTCTTSGMVPESTWGDVFGDLRTSGIPRFVTVYCPGGEQMCSGPQYWYVESITDSTQGWYYVPNPAQEMSFVPFSDRPAGSLGFTCQQNPGGGYQCTMGTGGPWGSWVLTAWYDLTSF